MKFLVIDDEHELYRVMMNDLFTQTHYQVEEVKRVEMPSIAKKIHDIYYSRKINRFFEMPGKSLWNHWYTLHNYPFVKDETYVVIFMNGSLRHYYNERYLKNIKKQHTNVKLCLLIFDKSIYYGAKRAISMRKCFDYVFSFDEEDCKKYGFIRFYNCFSHPYGIYKDNSKQSDAFFIGNAGGRLKKLQETFKFIATKDTKCNFFITGVDESNQEKIENVTYNKEMSFYEEMSYSYNSNCLIEILREGQTGISLRVCEAIAFNKKLITNNINIMREPFFDGRYMKVFTRPDEINVDFIKEKTNVNYNDTNIFSPVRILDLINRYENEKQCINI